MTIEDVPVLCLIAHWVVVRIDYSYLRLTSNQIKNCIKVEGKLISTSTRENNLHLPKQPRSIFSFLTESKTKKRIGLNSPIYWKQYFAYLVRNLLHLEIEQDFGWRWDSGNFLFSARCCFFSWLRYWRQTKLEQANTIQIWIKAVSLQLRKETDFFTEENGWTGKLQARSFLQSGSYFTGAEILRSGWDRDCEKKNQFCSCWKWVIRSTWCN